MFPTLLNYLPLGKKDVECGLGMVCNFSFKGGGQKNSRSRTCNRGISRPFDGLKQFSGPFLGELKSVRSLAFVVSKISATGDSEIICGFLEVAMGLIIMMKFFENGQRIGETGFERNRADETLVRVP